MIEHKINKLNNFIMGWYPNDVSICDELIDFHKTYDNKVYGTIGNGLLDKTIKDSIDVPLLIETPMWTKYLVHFLQPMTDLYIKKYPECNIHGSWTCKEQINIQHYKPNGGFFHWHCERGAGTFPIVSRHLVFMTYLNDVTDGGETEFYYQKIKIKPQKGLTLLWGSDWTFLHRGIPSPSQEKLIATGWYSYN
jgi:prolyl 4-hydroxylase